MSAEQDRRGHRTAGVALGVVLAIGLAAGTGGGEGLAQTEGPTRPLVAAVHVHSTLSTGALTLDELAQRARELGIDAIVLSENFALRYEYGLPPLRGVLRVGRRVPSVSAARAERFLQEVAAAQARHPDIIFVPGVETAPHYYWTGSLLTGDLTMHNAQRNLLVVGLTKPEDYRALPLPGNPASFRHGPGSWINLAPIALLAPAVWLWRAGGRRGAAARRLVAGSLVAGTLVLLLNAWPYGLPVFGPYEADLGYRPYQAVIEVVRDRGGLVFWSLPEARDRHRLSLGPLGTVTVQTEPHPESLLRTTGYTGFGALYQDTRGVTEPGAEWDRALAEHLTGARVFPVGLGEIAFHAPGQANIELGQVLNVLRVRDWTPSGVVEALHEGRLYAVGQFPPEGVALRLEEFSIAQGLGGRRARAGETVLVDEPATLEIQVRVTARDAERAPVSLKVIRSGRVVAATSGPTPFSFTHVDEIGKPVTPAYYRVEVKGRYAEILSNPIFVRPDSDVVSAEDGGPV